MRRHPRVGPLARLLGIACTGALVTTGLQHLVLTLPRDKTDADTANQTLRRIKYLMLQKGVTKTREFLNHKIEAQAFGDEIQDTFIIQNHSSASGEKTQPPPKRALTDNVLCVFTAARNGTSYLERTIPLWDESMSAAQPQSWSMLLVAGDAQSQDDARRVLNGVSVLEELRPSEAECDRAVVYPEGVPNCDARKQTLDVAWGLERCAAQASEWVVLIEDDTTPCGADAVAYMGDILAQFAHNRTDVQFSGFFSGTSFHVSNIPAFATNARVLTNMHPIDIIPHDRQRIEERRVIAHEGVISTFPYRNTEDYRTKYDEIRRFTCKDP